MPELPEVETVRRVLAQRLVGRSVLSLDLPRVSFNRKPDPAALRAAAVGRRLERIDRRGKYLILGFEGGREMILHLGMSGRLLLQESSPWTRMTIRFDGKLVAGQVCPDTDGKGMTLTFEDPRRFGFAIVKRPELGPEPLDRGFKPEDLRTALRDRKAPVHAVLMDQKTLAGVGNIYSTEALAAAGIRPGRRAATLTAAEAARLYRTLRDTLRRAVETGGSTLEDDGYKDPEGQSGGMQEHLRVYGRKHCSACGGPVKTTRKPLSGRTARYCPKCQR